MSSNQARHSSGSPPRDQSAALELSEVASGYVSGDPAAQAVVAEWARKWSEPFRSSLGDECEDAAQDALLEAGQALRDGRYRGDGSLEAFIARIVRFRCIDRLRRADRSASAAIDLDRLPTRAQSAFQRIEGQQSADALWSLFAKSPENCRQLWSMILDGLSYQEMSDKTGVRPGTLRVRVARCRQWAAERRAAEARK